MVDYNSPSLEEIGRILGGMPLPVGVDTPKFYQGLAAILNREPVTGGLPRREKYYLTGNELRDVREHYLKSKPILEGNPIIDPTDPAQKTERYLTFRQMNTAFKMPHSVLGSLLEYADPELLRIVESTLNKRPDNSE